MALKKKGDQYQFFKVNETYLTTRAKQEQIHTEHTAVFKKYSLKYAKQIFIYYVKK